MNLTRRVFLKRCLSSTAVAGLGGLAYATLIEPRRLETRHLTIRVSHLPAGLHGLTIAHLTDLHRSRFVSKSFLLAAVEQANDLRPDLTVFTGDYLTHGQSRKGQMIYGLAGNADDYMIDCAACIGAARATYGVCASLGNHDHWFDGNRCTELIEKAGVPVLRNSSTVVHINGESLPIVGLGDLWTEGTDFPKAFAGVDAPFSLVLMHNPDSFEHWPRQSSHLILAGHTHGGQVNLPFFGTPVVPSRYGQKYAHGLFQRDNTFMYVSRGIGLIYPPVRFNCRPEIALIRLERA